MALRLISHGVPTKRPGERSGGPCLGPHRNLSSFCVTSHLLFNASSSGGQLGAAARARGARFGLRTFRVKTEDSERNTSFPSCVWVAPKRVDFPAKPLRPLGASRLCLNPSKQPQNLLSRSSSNSSPQKSRKVNSMDYKNAEPVIFVD